MVNLDKFAGALLGAFVGDALGMPVENWTHEQITRKYGQVKGLLPNRLGVGAYTDDTEMMVGVAESIIECGQFNGEHMITRLKFNLNPHRGYGMGTIRAIENYINGVSWEQAPLLYFAGGSYANSGAARVAPVACAYVDQPNKLREVAMNTSRITHAHILAKEGAAIQAYTITLALNSDNSKDLNQHDFLDKIKSFMEPSIWSYRHKIILLESLLAKNPSCREVISKLGNDLTSIGSVLTAIYAFLSHSNSFEDAVLYSINLGGDTDSIGAMTGAISGAYHGKGGIPTKWLKKLENGPKGRDYIEDLAMKLWVMCQSRQKGRLISLDTYRRNRTKRRLRN
jgi:poly(ADP-ribose) glycohydrolase ARH3